MKKGFVFAMGIAIFTLSFLTVSGCEQESKAPVQQKSIKLMFQSQANYRSEYANVLDYKFPELKIEIIPYGDLLSPSSYNIESFVQLVDTHKPDIISIIAIPDLFETMIREGRLVALDPYISKHRFDIDHAPILTNLVRAKGEGKIYGLPSSFSTQALYYNKDLFDTFKIEYPRNGMSFREVLDLAKRFADPGNTQPITGLYMKYMTPGNFLRYVGNMEGLQWLDANGQNITIHTPAWEKVFSNVVGAYRSGAMFDGSLLPNQTENNEFYKDYQSVIERARRNSLFATGHAAMTIDDGLLINDINRFQPEMNWDLAALPSNGLPVPSGYVRTEKIYAILSATSHAEEAWKVLQLLNSDQMDKTNAGIYGFRFNQYPVRMKNISFPQQKNMMAFYSLTTEEKGAAAGAPFGFIQFLDRTITELVNDKMSISDALRTIQEQGNALLKAEQSK